MWEVVFWVDTVHISSSPELIVAAAMALNHVTPRSKVSRNNNSQLY